MYEKTDADPKEVERFWKNYYKHKANAVHKAGNLDQSELSGRKEFFKYCDDKLQKIEEGA